MNLWRRYMLRLRLRGIRARVEASDRIFLQGRLRIMGPGLVRIGDDVLIDGKIAPVVLYTRAGSEIIIGDGTVLESGVDIGALQSVHVGARCRIGAFCKILDNNFHLVEGDRLATPDSRPVILEEDVTLGPRVILLPGAHLGRGTHVKPGVAFSHRTPPRAVVVGHPARVLRKS